RKSNRAYQQNPLCQSNSSTLDAVERATSLSSIPASLGGLLTDRPNLRYKISIPTTRPCCRVVKDPIAMFYRSLWRVPGTGPKDRATAPRGARRSRARHSQHWLETLEDRRLLATTAAVTPGAISGMGTLLNKQDLFKVGVQASVVGGVATYSGT